MKRLVLALLLLNWSASPALGAGLKLEIHDGLVSLDAQDVTVRQILTEWARVGKTEMINVERITGGPITLKFDDTPEKQALDIVLRTIPGYVALPRATPVADASRYDRILIMATTTVVAPLRPQPPGPGFTGIQVPGFPGMYGGAQGGANVTQLRPNPSAPLSPGTLPEPMDSADQADQMDDPAIAAAAAAGLVPVPALNPGPVAVPTPLTAPGGAVQEKPTPPAPGAGSPTNPWNVPVGTSQPSLAPPAPPVQAPPATRPRPPQADR